MTWLPLPGYSPFPIASAQAQPAAGVKLSAEKWWPSKWGAEDEAGASNHITPAKVLDAAKWIRDGKVYKMGRVYEQAMPCFGQRAFLLRIPGGPTGGPFGENKLVYNDEFLATEIGQTGTQFDGLGRIGIRLRPAMVSFRRIFPSDRPLHLSRPASILRFRSA